MIDRISIPTTPGISRSKPVIKDGDRKRRDQPLPQRKPRNNPDGDKPDRHPDGTPHIDEYI